MDAAEAIPTASFLPSLLSLAPAGLFSDTLPVAYATIRLRIHCVIPRALAIRGRQSDRIHVGAFAMHRLFASIAAFPLSTAPGVLFRSRRQPLPTRQEPRAPLPFQQRHLDSRRWKPALLPASGRIETSGHPPNAPAPTKQSTRQSKPHCPQWPAPASAKSFSISRSSASLPNCMYRPSAAVVPLSTSGLSLLLFTFSSMAFLKRKSICLTIVTTRLMMLLHLSL